MMLAFKDRLFRVDATDVVFRVLLVRFECFQLTS